MKALIMTKSVVIRSSLPSLGTTCYISGGVVLFPTCNGRQGHWSSGYCLYLGLFIDSAGVNLNYGVNYVLS